MASLVNLDALLPREDLAERHDVPNFSSIHTIGITQLEAGFFSNALRKPDFQRETSDWTPTKVFDLIRAFVDGELVPPVILWQAGGRVFVIDGAHRLSALMAWVNNDYGDGDKSKTYFQNQIPPEQIKVADRTRKMVHAEIGAYSEYLAVSKGVGKADKKIEDRIGRLATVAVPLHWVPTVSFKQAERSFFKINQAATPIDKTELRILNSRETPSAIAARAIMRGRTGHKYWADFDKDVQTEIESIAKKIRNALYEPPLETPHQNA